MNYIQRIYDLLVEAQINEVGNPAQKVTKTALSPKQMKHAVKLGKSGGHKKAQAWVHKEASRTGKGFVSSNPTPAQEAGKAGSDPTTKTGKPGRGVNQK